MSCAIIETKKALATERIEEKAARWDELKSTKDEKWRSKFVAKKRKVKTEKHRLALKVERLAKDKETEWRDILLSCSWSQT
jgi:hypothetical protein